MTFEIGNSAGESGNSARPETTRGTLLWGAWKGLSWVLEFAAAHLGMFVVVSVALNKQPSWEDTIPPVLGFGALGAVELALLAFLVLKGLKELGEVVDRGVDEPANGWALANAGGVGALVVAIVLVGAGCLMFSGVFGIQADAHTTARSIVAALLILLGAALPPTLAGLVSLWTHMWLVRADLRELRRAVLGLPSERNTGELWSVVDQLRKSMDSMESFVQEEAT